MGMCSVILMIVKRKQRMGAGAGAGGGGEQAGPRLVNDWEKIRTGSETNILRKI